MGQKVTTNGQEPQRADTQMSCGQDQEKPDTDSFLEVVLEHILHTLSSADLQQLLTDDVAWEILVETTDLTRVEVDAVRGALIEKILQATERFLNEFSLMKKQLQEGIAKLYALAEKVDKVHKDCTITNVVASSSGAVSGILTILGVALAPVTAGGSLALSATGIGLGAAAAVTRISSSFVDHSNKLSAQGEARCLLATSMDTEKEVVSATKKCGQASQGKDKLMNAINMAKSDPQIVTNASRLVKAGEMSFQSGLVQRIIGGTALGMSTAARITGAGTAGVFLLWDVCNLVRDSVLLHKGAKTESAAELRQQAQDLERKLEELIQIHESLQLDLTK
ncbi:PREDICTED: apolipoprotein L3-like [Chinchilla lanigera]|uniref:Apolipoprotein L3-like n=1 Tax=Chinchilla lanigera TaxID=34839 RepID=A0A8C2W1E6_CHILA|nr:PREDICTED: apolipoprotein L3-like [Chinchilla lanigera]